MTIILPVYDPTKAAPDHQFSVDCESVNIGLLTHELQKALADELRAVSKAGDQLTLFLVNAPNEQTRRTIRQIVRDHRADQLTPEQEKRQRQEAKLKEARVQFGGTPLNLADYESAPPSLKQLAQKIAWLEAELAELVNR
jgi:hypothetical protein